LFVHESLMWSEKLVECCCDWKFEIGVKVDCKIYAIWDERLRLDCMHAESMSVAWETEMRDKIARGENGLGVRETWFLKHGN